MMELRDLYQSLIIDHNKHPRNFYQLEDATVSARGNNPLCGDQLTLYLKIENNQIKKVSFLGVGCAISIASASLMTESLQDIKKDEALHLFHKIHTMLTQDVPHESLGKLDALAGVRAYPARVKCATLSWHTLVAALENTNQIATTE